MSEIQRLFVINLKGKIRWWAEVGLSSFLSFKKIHKGRVEKNSMASLFTARGEDAKKSAKKKQIDFKKVYIRLKDGDSVRVRLLGKADYAEYLAHGDYNLGILTQPCIEPLGKECPMCIAANSGVPKFDKLYAKKRYLFAFADIDSGEIRVWDATKNQGEAMMDLIDEYADVIDEVAFTFKRTGNKNETTYNLIPIMKLKEEDKAKFAKFDGQTVPKDFFDQVLVPRTEKQMIEALQKAGFPVADFFDLSQFATEEENSETKEDGEPEEIPANETDVF
jgi:hypothetical protein